VPAHHFGFNSNFLSISDAISRRAVAFLYMREIVSLYLQIVEKKLPLHKRENFVVFDVSAVEQSPERVAPERFEKRRRQRIL